jgi:hypothetical protein
MKVLGGSARTTSEPLSTWPSPDAAGTVTFADAAFDRLERSAETELTARSTGRVFALAAAGAED